MKIANQTTDLATSLIRIRLIEERIAKLYSEQQMRCPVHISVGQEAAAVGVCAHLTPNDYAVSGHRAHAHYLAKGGDLKKMLAEIYGKESGCCRGRGGSMHLVDLDAGFMGSTPIVGSSLPVGVGLSFGSQLRKEERVTTIFFGEGATEEGVFAESLNFAALRSLPILFVCENNFFSVYSPLSVRQPKKRSIVNLAKAHGIEAFLEEGNDVNCVYDLTAKALEVVRREQRPVLLELTTYRYYEHCGPNLDPLLPKAELEYWKKRDPILNLHLPPEETDAIQKEIDEAFAFAKSSPFPKVEQEGTTYA
ncbi:MAG: Acetoin:2,6-dichlorophenolindophenol oxidoreductase subunit alpha [Chlamydiales bacterium]|nr:Acetoin:2,6-dichlorophenolindophenol oxidoreductase subunit alpha [Chlamydiales bacterium]MCH9619481.1 Acetoin:2,6-dichlorophenolindophenol oxidoreductase subunit alpha [Chlamydiales bacterium]MCH9622285.1 Acetoin:2,6-dichlorophenolindophenol oxidoreductase subunit alpha [Chlamydiales bacterium]